MDRLPAERMRLAATVLGALTASVTLLAAVVFYAFPRAVDSVGPVSAAGLSVMTLSLPVWAAVQAYALRDAPSLPRHRRRPLFVTAWAAVAAFLLGFVVVAAEPNSPHRAVGDGLYAVGVVLLLAVSAVSLVLRRENG